MDSPVLLRRSDMASCVVRRGSSNQGRRLSHLRSERVVDDHGGDGARDGYGGAHGSGAGGHGLASALDASSHLANVEGEGCDVQRPSRERVIAVQPRYLHAVYLVEVSVSAQFWVDSHHQSLGKPHL